MVLSRGGFSFVFQRFSLGRPSMSPRRPEDAPSRPKTPLTCPQDAHKAPQDAPKTPIEAAKTPPKHPRDARNTPQNAPKMPPGRPQDAYLIIICCMSMTSYAMSERYEHLILPLSSHSSSAPCLRCHLRMLCAHTTYRAIFATTVPLRVLLSHTTIAHNFRMLVSQGIFACHVRTLASALFFFRRYCCTLFTHASFACQLRTCSAYDMFARNCRKLF